jgi:hypothetical protein
VTPARAVGRLALLLAGLATGAPAPAAAQKAQWTDVVYVPGRWAGGRLVAGTSSNPKTDSLALVMRVDYFSRPPRWRAEIRRSGDGQTMGAPDVLVGDGAQVVVITALGSTPFEQHALGKDPLVRAVVAVLDATGRRQGPSSGRLAERAANGTVGRIVFRRAVPNANFADALLDAGARGGGRNLLASGITAVGDQRRASVVATAGARGVDRVKTPGGEVPVRPDSAAILRMERFTVGAVALEDFLRTGGLGPYAPAKADSGGARP